MSKIMAKNEENPCPTCLKNPFKYTRGSSNHLYLLPIGFPRLHFFSGFQLTVKNQSQRTFRTVFPSFGYVSLATSRCCCCYYLKKVSTRVFKESKCSKCNQRFCEKRVYYYWPKKVVKCQITDDLAKSFVIFV